MKKKAKFFPSFENKLNLGSDTIKIALTTNKVEFSEAKIPPYRYAFITKKVKGKIFREIIDLNK